MSERVVTPWRMWVGTSMTLISVACSMLLLGGTAEARSDDARPKCRGKEATIVGTPRDDEIVGTAKADVIVGGGGMDRIDGGRGDDIICGGPGPTRYVHGDPVPQILDGGPGNDVIVGGSGDEVLEDFAGSDLFIGRGGGDVLSDGSQGNGADGDVLKGGAGGDQLVAGRGADELYGGTGDDWFQDALGNNTLRGGGGNDRFDSGLGDDTIFGGAGVDSSRYIAIPRGSGAQLGHCNDIIADLSTGVASGKDFGFDALRGIEDLATSGGDDVLTGDHRDNTFYVGGPCPGGGAPAQLNSVVGGGGSDRIDFNGSTWDYSVDAYAVEVDLSTGTAVQRSPYDDGVMETIVGSVENVTGTPYPDVIYGDNGPNRLSGAFPQGKGQADKIYGRGGNDRLSGSDGPDTISGDEGDDTLRGLSGNDRLDGGPGDNLVRGGPGKDSCQNPDSFNGALSCEA